MRLQSRAWLLAALLSCACGGGGSAAPSSAPAVSDAPAATAAVEAPRLRVSGTQFESVEGRPFQWRGITAFRLLDYIADGQDARAAEYLAWASKNGLTVVRVLGMVDGFFELKPDEGRAALPRLLALASEHGVQVELVALAGTATIPVDFQAHVRETGRILAERGGFLEVANEPVHPTQHPDVHKPAYLQSLAAAVPDAVLVALGSIERGEGFADGDYITWHVPRDHRHDGWGHVLAVAEGASLVARWQKPVVSDEPIGAGPEFVAGRRDNSAARFRAAALLTRLAGLGATFHYEGGLQAAIPHGRELECFLAWNEAWTLLPEDLERRGAFHAAASPGGVALRGTGPGVLAAYERVTEQDGWALVLGPDGSRDVDLAPGWRVDESRDFDGVRLIRLARLR